MPKCIERMLTTEVIIEENDIQLIGKIVNNIKKNKGVQEFFITIFYSDNGENYLLLVPSNHPILIESCFHLENKRCYIGVRKYSSPWENRYKLLWTLAYEV